MHATTPPEPPLERVPPAREHRSGRWRSVPAALLVAVAALLAPVSVLATWAQSQVEDTDRCLEAVAPLAEDPAVQEAVAARVEQVVFTHVDVDASIERLVDSLESRGLPAAATATLEAAAGPAASGVRSFVSDRIHEFVRSDAFRDAWTAANRVTHRELTAALQGRGRALTIEEGRVTIALAPIIEAVKARLVAAGFTLAARIPAVDTTFTILQSDRLATVQRLMRVLDALSLWLPVLALGSLGLAVVLARDRRRAVFAGALAVAGAMLVLGAALHVLRPLYLGALPPDSSPAAAGAVYDQFASSLRSGLRGVLVAALAVAVGAWLIAPGGSGAAARAGLRRTVASVGGGRAASRLRTGRPGRLLGRYRVAVRTVVLAVPLVWFVVADHPSEGTAVVLVVGAAVLLLVVELLTTNPSSGPAPAAGPAAGTEAPVPAAPPGAADEAPPRAPGQVDAGRR